jgi:hypothetical protein
MNKIQEIILNLIENTRFNNFDGKKIAKDLRENEDKWKGVVFGRFTYWTLMPLRDIDKGIYNADTIFIKLPKKGLEWLKTMAKKWRVDEFGYYFNGETEGTFDENLQRALRDCLENDVVYARLWWD